MMKRSGGFSGLQNSNMMKKKKHLLKQKDPDKKGTKKTKQAKKDSELKNKACVNLPIIRECSSDSETLTDTRKMPKIAKNKRDRTLSCEREGDYEVPLEDMPKEQQGSNFLNRLARKRSAPISNGEDAEFIVKRKKKKKGGKEEHNHACPLTLLTKDEAPKQIFANPKVISQDSPLSSREKKRTDVQNGSGDVVKKKKAAFSLTSVDNRESGKDILDAGLAGTLGRFHKGHRSKKRTRGHEEQQDDTHVEETDIVSQKWGKKKKKPKKELVALECLTSVSSQEKSSGVSNENSLRPKSKTKKVLIDPEPDDDEDGKMMKKNQTQPKVGSNRLTLLKDGKDVPVKEKKGKKSKVLQVHTGSGNEYKVGKKKKKGKDNESMNFQNPVEEEPGLRKAKLKREREGLEDEIKVVAVKKGNCDEVTIDKQRRRALQEEIDRESGRTKIIEEEKESDGRFGQWGAAAFENSERKAKFLRLLGGFKKGPSVPAPGSPASDSKVNMALGRSREKELSQSLETEFEKALERKHRRATGLGFQPGAQKQAHIDKYASQSIKFED